MKKLLYSGILALAGLFAIACTTEEEHVVFNKENVVAPVLNNVEGATLAADGADITANFSLADFGFVAASTYTLELSATERFDEVQKLSANITILDEEETPYGEVTIKQSALNSALLNMGASPDAPFTTYMRIKASVVKSNNSAIEETVVYSEVISAQFVPYNTLVLDVDSYEHVWVIGTYCGWSHDETQFLYNYSKDGKTFSGVIDFADKAANGFKLTGVAGWDDSCNWGSENQDETSEQASIQLISSGGSKDIKCYSKRYYHFTFDNTTLVLKADWGLNKIGIVGGFNGWGNDIFMSYNPTYCRFYADVELSEATELKFRADEGWDLNWGADFAVGGDNISVEAGNYRVYLNFNKGEYSFDANMYGKDEPGVSGGEGGDEPVAPSKPSVWSLAGDFNGWSNADTTYELSNNGGDIWTINGVEFTESNEFKILADHDWSVSVGGPEENATSTIDAGNPYGVYQPVLGTAFTCGDKNIKVGVAGTYDITFDYSANTIVVIAHEGEVVDLAEQWSVIGTVNDSNWNLDVDMTLSGGLWTATFNLTGAEFKLRKAHGWDINRGGNFTAFGEPFEVTQDGPNIKPGVTGTMKVTYDPTAETITVEAVGEVVGPQKPSVWSIAGDLNGWNKDDTTYELTNTSGDVWTISNVALTEHNEFKILADHDWSVSVGGPEENATSTIDAGNPYGVYQPVLGTAFTCGDKNIKVGVAGTYDITFDYGANTILVVAK